MELRAAHKGLCRYTDHFKVSSFEQIHALTAEHNVNVESRIDRDVHSVHTITR
jgi:hypothetical protein